MKSSPITRLLSLTLLLVSTEAILVPHKVHIIVYNDLGPRKTLTIHCKSKNNSLGIRHVAYGHYYQFKFRPNFLRNTLFYCSMKWDRRVHRFDIYVQARDRAVCETCVWKVRPDGPCLFAYNRVCYSWNPA
ncbi:hypothetical protein HRI_001704900 [Hibiscus trionum]|uniref:S-protein homolog n=1 Tax=Hibiscus trionum TaxID=183268 RepID=A0A9W7HN50_HIBTR|nr:hypothetical protein HRI_001704900 [Hibiscus trionum]